MEKIRVYFEEGSYYLLTNDKKILVEFPDGNAWTGGEGCADINGRAEVFRHLYKGLCTGDQAHRRRVGTVLVSDLRPEEVGLWSKLAAFTIG